MTLNKEIKIYDEPHTPQQLDNAYKNWSKHSKINSLNKVSSYIEQIKTIVDLKIKTVLEIGGGESITKPLLEHFNHKVSTMDIEKQYKPDILSDLKKFKVTDKHRKQFDLVCAFQMLEHLPFEEFENNLIKMRSLTKKYVFISLPYFCDHFRLKVVLPCPEIIRKELPEVLKQGLKHAIDINIRLPKFFAKQRRYRSEYKRLYPQAVHHWEINRGESSLNRVLNKIRLCDLKIIKKFHNKINPYHYFILCEAN